MTTTFLDLPGELRNSVYDAIIDHNRTVRLSEDGRVLQHSISRASRQIKHEFDSLFSDITSAPQRLEAKVLNFDVRGLHDFFHRNATHFDTQPHEAKVVMAMTDPSILEHAAHFDALHDWLNVSAARGWNVQYHVEFDWSSYTNHAARLLTNHFGSPLGDGATATTLGGQMLQRALLQAREARVRKQLVQRPARWARRGDEPKSEVLRSLFLRGDF